MSARYKSLSALVLILVCSVLVAAQSEPRRPGLPELPTPSGPFGIGRVAFDWIDSSRPADIPAEAAAPGEPSELMVYVWYPTRASDRKAMGVLFPGIKEIDSAPDLVPGVKSGPIFGGNWPLVFSGKITSHVQDHAAIATSPKKFPLVIFSPASFGTCFEYTSAIEELVSNGYVVAAIEHTYETFAITFPTGQVRVLPTKAIRQRYLAQPGSSPEEAFEKLSLWNRRRADVRASDISFTLDKLTQLNKETSSQFSGRLDLTHVAAIGHSKGGWAAILACRRDDRFRACINLDGSADGEGLRYPGASIPRQPILYVEIPKTLELPEGYVPLKKLHLTAVEWVQKWHEGVEKELNSFPAGGDFVQLQLPEMDHYDFSDRGVLAAGREDSEEQKSAALRRLRLTEAVTRTFLDRYLKEDDKAILRGNAEMTVKHFGPNR